MNYLINQKFWIIGGLHWNYTLSYDFYVKSFFIQIWLGKMIFKDYGLDLPGFRRLCCMREYGWAVFGLWLVVASILAA